MYNRNIIVKKRRKRLLPAILPLSVLLSVLFGLSADAEQDLKPTDRFFVNDFSNVLTASDADTIYSTGVQLQDKTSAQVVAVAVDSLDGADIREKGLEIARDWGIGQKGKDNGVLLLLAVKDRKVSIEVGYGLEGGLTDTETGIILDTYATPYFKKDDFSAGMREAYKAIVNEVYIEYGMQPEQGYTPVKQIEAKKDWNPYAFIPVGVVILIALSSIFRRGRRGGGWFPFIFFGGGGRGGFGGGGGGFGGGGSSRGF